MEKLAIIDSMMQHTCLVLTSAALMASCLRIEYILLNWKYDSQGQNPITTNNMRRSINIFVQ